MNLSRICSTCSSVFVSMEPRSLLALNFWHNSMHLLYLLSNFVGLPLKDDGGIICWPADWECIQNVYATCWTSFFGIFCIINVWICKSYQCILVLYLIRHMLVVVHCRLSAFYLREAWKWTNDDSLYVIFSLCNIVIS
jgi:hypothetical protein